MYDGDLVCVVVWFDGEEFVFELFDSSGQLCVVGWVCCGVEESVEFFFVLVEVLELWWLLIVVQVFVGQIVGSLEFGEFVCESFFGVVYCYCDDYLWYVLDYDDV